MTCFDSHRGGEFPSLPGQQGNVVVLPEDGQRLLPAGPLEDLQMNEEGKLEGPQKLWFSETRPAEELYDLRSDPKETVNIAEQEPEVVDSLRTVLLDWIGSRSTESRFKETVDEETMEALRSLGYIN